MFRKKFENENNDSNEKAGLLGLFPAEIRQHILSFLNIESLNAIKNVATIFYHDREKILARNPLFWEKIFIDLGFNSQLIYDTTAMNAISDYRNLYRVLSHMNTKMKEYIQYPWQLLCISGDPKAIDKGITDSIFPSAQDENFNAIILYATLSGVPAQLDKALSMGIAFDANESSLNVLHYAILSGTRMQIEKVLALEEAQEKKLPRIDKRRRQPLHFAVISNFPDQIDVVREFFGGDFEMKDKNDDTPLSYVANPKVNEKIQHLMSSLETKRNTPS